MSELSVLTRNSSTMAINNKTTCPLNISPSKCLPNSTNNFYKETDVEEDSVQFRSSSMDNINDDVDDDDDSEVVRVKPIRPLLRWRDSGFHNQTMEALNQMRRNRHFCDVTLQVRKCTISKKGAIYRNKI